MQHTHTYIHTYIHTCMHACMHACIHTYIHTCIPTYLPTYLPTYIHTYTCVNSPRPPSEGWGGETGRERGVHPVCCLGFVSDWTQPLDIISADSECMCYYLSTKRCLGNPTLGTNLTQRILAMRRL